MLRPRAPRFPQLQAYLEARPSHVKPPNQGGGWLAACFISIVLVGPLFSVYGTFALLGLMAAIIFGIMGARLATQPKHMTDEERLRVQADGIARTLKPHAKSNRLHRTLHPGVGLILEESAGYWLRISAAINRAGWDQKGTWERLRSDVMAAADTAMDEALTATGGTLGKVEPVKPLEAVSDALEDVGFGPLIDDRYRMTAIPPEFAHVREIAERLRELAERTEQAAKEQHQTSPAPTSTATSKLDWALGEMRQLEQAENELRQGG